MRAQPIDLLTRGLLTVAAAIVLAAGCGGVDSGGTGAVAVGPITGFGSIFVNGVRFDETNAEVLDEDGAPLGRDRLALGVVTEVEGSRAVDVGGSLSAVASSIRISSELLGPVTAVDPAAGSLVVLGQAVRVTSSTTFDASLAGGLAGVATGSVVEIYGRLDSVAMLYTATRVEARATPAAYKLRGPITVIDGTARTLTIGGQTIDYSLVPAAEIADIALGRIVRAVLQPAQVAGNWVAVSVRPGVVRLPDSLLAKLEGRISSWTSSRAFSVDGIAVDARAASFDGSEAAVVLGARVKVEGTARGGYVVARNVEVEDDEGSSSDLFQVRGTIQTHDPVAMTFTVRGIVIDYAGNVDFRGGSAGDIAVGRRVRVLGVLASDRASIAAQTISFTVDDD